MPIFQPLDVEFRLDTLQVEEHADRFLGGVEPYILPIFFKLDGERYAATLRIFNTQPPVEGTTQPVETTPIQFVLQSDPVRTPLIFLPPGPLLFDQTLEAGDTMDVSNISFTTTLEPIPLVIDVLGLFDLRDILEELAGIIDQQLLEGELVDLLNLTFGGISDVLAAALGLDEAVEACPGPAIDTEGFINQIEAELNSLIPGTIGGAFAAMENDDFDEDDALTMQSTIRAEVVRVINDLTDSVTRVNPIPDPSEDAVDPDELVGKIIGDLFFRCDPVFWFVSIVGFLWASADEFVNFHLQQFDHQSIDSATENNFSAVLEGSENRWRIEGSLAVQ